MASGQRSSQLKLQMREPMKFMKHIFTKPHPSNKVYGGLKYDVPSSLSPTHKVTVKSTATCASTSAAVIFSLYPTYLLTGLLTYLLSARSVLLLTPNKCTFLTDELMIMAEAEEEVKQKPLADICVTSNKTDDENVVKCTEKCMKYINLVATTGRKKKTYLNLSDFQNIPFQFFNTVVTGVFINKDEYEIKLLPSKIKPDINLFDDCLLLLGLTIIDQFITGDLPRSKGLMPPVSEEMVKDAIDSAAFFALDGKLEKPFESEEEESDPEGDTPKEDSPVKKMDATSLKRKQPFAKWGPGTNNIKRQRIKIIDTVPIASHFTPHAQALPSLRDLPDEELDILLHKFKSRELQVDIRRPLIDLARSSNVAFEENFPNDSAKHFFTHLCMFSLMGYDIHEFSVMMSTANTSNQKCSLSCLCEINGMEGFFEIRGNCDAALYYYENRNYLDRLLIVECKDSRNNQFSGEGQLLAAMLLSLLEDRRKIIYGLLMGKAVMLCSMTKSIPTKKICCEILYRRNNCFGLRSYYPVMHLIRKSLPKLIQELKTQYDDH